MKWLRCGMAVLAGVLLAACSPIPRPGSWQMAGTFSGLAFVSDIFALPGGRVLVLGAGSGAIFDVNSGNSRRIPDPPRAHEGGTATLLSNGSVLVAGGNQEGGPGDEADVFLPDASRWVSAGKMSVGRSQHAAVRLRDGRVLVVGGATQRGANATAEIYDPSTRAWTPTGSMGETRVDLSAIALDDGRVLVTGGYRNQEAGTFGFRGESDRLYDGELYDPRAGVWRPLNHPLPSNPEMTRLADGTILLTGGTFGRLGSPLTQVFDPKTGGWSQKKTSTGGGDAVVLKDGRVFFVSSFGGSLYDPKNDLELPATQFSTGSTFGGPPFRIPGFPIFASRSAVGLRDGRVFAVTTQQVGFDNRLQAATFDPNGFPTLPGSTGPLASTKTVEALAAAALAMILLAGLRAALLGRPRRRP